MNSAPIGLICTTEIMGGPDKPGHDDPKGFGRGHPVKVGILKTGRPPKPAIAEFGTYPDMFMRLLGPDAYDWRTYDVDGGELPAAPEDCAAYIVTGSAAGVYENDPWIGGLLDFLRAARGRTKLVGVCFGHQAMAQAFGGKVIKSPKGWGIGAHDYQVVGQRPGWMTRLRSGCPPPIRIRWWTCRPAPR